MKSLRSALVASLLAAVVAVVLAGTLAVHRELAEELGEVYDAELAREAGGALRAPAGLEPDFANAHDDPGEGTVVAVWKDEAAAPLVLAGAAQSPEVLAGLGLSRRPGYSTLRIGDHNWRVYSVVGDRIWVCAAQPMAVREHAIRKIERRLRALLAGMVACIAVLVWWLVTRGLRPLRRFADEVAERTPSALRPVFIERLPAEIIPVALSLNALLSRLERALAAQQRFVADAAHELLTPLAAVRVHLQMLDRAPTEERRATAIADLRQGLARCTRLARQLLELARQSPDAPQPDFQMVDLAQVAADMIAEAQGIALTQKTDLGLEDGRSACVSGDAENLRVLVRNLIDNAIKYTPPGGRVDLSTGIDAGNAWLRVSDTGPGVIEADRERVFDRFYRAGGTEAEGSGLGLSIVREIAARHGATVSLASPGRLGGLDAELRLPAIEAASVS